MFEFPGPWTKSQITLLFKAHIVAHFIAYLNYTENCKNNYLKFIRAIFLMEVA